MSLEFEFERNLMIYGKMLFELLEEYNASRKLLFHDDLTVSASPSGLRMTRVIKHDEIET